MKVGITGAAGFIGWHLRCYLATRSDVEAVRLAGREAFSDVDKLREFVDGLDLIVHLAGVNRAEDDELISGNIEPAKLLVEALNYTNEKPFLIYTSSTKVQEGGTSYSEGKAAVTELFQAWSKLNATNFANLIIPHVFGEYGRPFYNSAIATFAYQVARGERPTIHDDGQLELIHVQDLVQQIISIYERNMSGEIRIKGRPTGVVEAAALLESLHEAYIKDGQLPNLEDHFVRCMFNTMRGALGYDRRVITVTKHEDNRGWLVETVKAKSGGQCFVSTTKPQITRGNHFHLRKVERFMVLHGKAQIKIRKMFSDVVITYDLDGHSPSFVDMPTMHTHSITNVGGSDLITLFWADEIFDPENPDTSFEEVGK